MANRASLVPWLTDKSTTFKNLVEEAVAELLARVGFEGCYPVRDLNNRPRHSVGYKPRPLEPLD